MHTYSTCKLRKNPGSINYKWFIYTINGYFTYVAEGKFYKLQDHRWEGNEIYLVD